MSNDRYQNINRVQKIPKMKDEQIITAKGDNHRRRIIYLVPFFLGAVAIGFLLQFSTYESLNFSEIRLAIVNLPHKWNRKPSRPPYKLPSFDKERGGLDNRGLVEQTENETAIIDNISKAPPSQQPIEMMKAKMLQLWEQPYLLNLKNFSWLMNNESLCKPDFKTPANTPLMPVLVHTARSNFIERLAIRKSWASVPIYKKWDVRIVFLLGEADRGANPDVNRKEYEEQEKKLNAEQKMFGDMVIGSFIDSYHNLTYKHLMGYKWILNFCSNATFVLKVDDDMFIDILRWIDWRNEDFDKLQANKSAKIPELYCCMLVKTKPFRENGSKWYASKIDWPEEYYPDYCNGWAYSITVSLLQKLYSVSNDTKFFWIDDAFATGALMEVVKKKYRWKPEIKDICGNVTSDTREYTPLCDKATLIAKREFRAVVYVPRGDLFERDMMCMWNKTLHDSTYNFTASANKIH